mmetsp:Transcript_83362/g.214676  ORF Transcript_83362/g.214676 Transcript_83362/m.214676 type:complete len:235 (+) Transcript_83362:365-1069(+)
MSASPPGSDVQGVAAGDEGVVLHAKEAKAVLHALLLGHGLVAEVDCLLEAAAQSRERDNDRAQRPERGQPDASNVHGGANKHEAAGGGDDLLGSRQAHRLQLELVAALRHGRGNVRSRSAEAVDQEANLRDADVTEDGAEDGQVLSDHVDAAVDNGLLECQAELSERRGHLRDIEDARGHVQGLLTRRLRGIDVVGLERRVVIVGDAPGLLQTAVNLPVGRVLSRARQVGRSVR